MKDAQLANMLVFPDDIQGLLEKKSRSVGAPARKEV